MPDQVIQFSLPETWFRFEKLSYMSPYQANMHYHQAWQLTASLDGEFRFRTRGKTVFVGPGEWVLMSPGFFHDAGSDSRRSTAIQLFFRRFPKSLLPDFAAHYNFNRDFMRKGRLDSVGILQELTDDLQLHCSEKSKENDSWKVMLTLRFILTLLSPIPESDRQEIHPQIIKAVEYMEEHFAEPVAVADMAAAVSLSENRFAVLFKEKTGCTPMQFLNSLRLDNAQSLLLQGCSITEAASQSGFSSDQYFCRYFRKNTGKTPGEFRKVPFRHENDDGEPGRKKLSGCCTSSSTCI